MRYPEFLKDFGAIGCIAPSFGSTRPIDVAQHDAAIGCFEGLGYSYVEGPNCRLNQGEGRSNTATECAKEVNDFFINDKADVIFAAGGGELMCEILPYVDFEGIKKARPKWYMGYSDNTNLTFLLPTLCDIAAIYGSGIKAFGQLPWHQCMYDQLALIRGEKFSVSNYDGFEGARYESENFLAPFGISEPYKQIIYNPADKAVEGACAVAKEEAAGEVCAAVKEETAGEVCAKDDSGVNFSGRAIGGCIDSLNVLCGTEYDRVKEFVNKYKEDGIVWFLEDCELMPFQVRRILFQFEKAGWFENVKGFIFGRPLSGRDATGFTHEDAIVGILSKYNVPIVMETDLGHLPPRIPYVSGGLCNVNAKGNSFSIEFDLK